MPLELCGPPVRRVHSPFMKPGKHTTSAGLTTVIKMRYALSNQDRQEVIVLGLLILSAIGIGWYLNMPQKWIAGITLTIIVFGFALSAFRESWRERWFWVGLPHCS